MLSTLGVGLASAYELTARNKLCALLVEGPDQLGPYLTSFSVVFNVGKLVGPPIGGLLLAALGPVAALGLDAASYLLPIAALTWLMAPHREREQRSQRGQAASVATAWRDCGPALRQVLRFTALACLVGFFHPGLAPLIANELLGSSPQALGVFTSVLAAGSICGGVILQRHCPAALPQARPAARHERPGHRPGPAGHGGGHRHGQRDPHQPGHGLPDRGWHGLPAGGHQPDHPGGLTPGVCGGAWPASAQVAFLGGGGLSGLLAAGLTMLYGLQACFALLGESGLVIAALGTAQPRFPAARAGPGLGAAERAAADATRLGPLQISLTPRTTKARAAAAVSPPATRSR